MIAGLASPPGIGQHPSMLTARSPVGATEVARHYDELDLVYRDLWGDHLHHGLWDNEQDDRSAESATLHLLEELLALLPGPPGGSWADIGSGYGATARWLAAHHGLQVTALTLSPVQAAQARRAPPPPQGEVEYRVEDWLHNSLPENSLDGALAVEVLAHVGDKALFFRQLRRSLKPGASAGLAIWTVADDLQPAERFLLTHLCNDGRLAGIGTLGDYRELAGDAGLRITTAAEVSARVVRTWTHILRRGPWCLLRRPRHLAFLLRQLLRGRLYLFTIPAMLLVYRTGALRYALVAVERPADSVAEVPLQD